MGRAYIRLVQRLVRGHYRQLPSSIRRGTIWPQPGTYVEPAYAKWQRSSHLSLDLVTSPLLVPADGHIKVWAHPDENASSDLL